MRISKAKASARAKKGWKTRRKNLTVNKAKRGAATFGAAYGGAIVAAGIQHGVYGKRVGLTPLTVAGGVTAGKVANKYAQKRWPDNFNKGQSTASSRSHQDKSRKRR